MTNKNKEPEEQIKEQTIYSTAKDFYKMPNNLLINISQNCGATAALIFAVLLSHRNNVTGICYPSITTLANECAMSKTSISTAILKLANKNYINYKKGGIKNQNGKKVNIANMYYFPCIDFDAEKIKKIKKTEKSKKPENSKKSENFKKPESNKKQQNNAYVSDIINYVPNYIEDDDKPF